MEAFELPKTFDEFVDARKAGFLKVKEFKENGGETGRLSLLLHAFRTDGCSRCRNGGTLRYK